MSELTELQRVSRILRATADAIDQCEMDVATWKRDYLWTLSVPVYFVGDSGPPEVLVTQVSDELEFLESDLAVFPDGSGALPYMLYKVADLLRGCHEAIVIK